MRTMGTVKWFDPTTGAGCAVSDGGMQAAFTAATLRPFGLAAIEAGVALVYDVKLEAGRLIVGTIHEIAGKGPHSAVSTGKQPGTVLRVTGRVQWFDRAKGFGFVVSKDVDADVLLHRSVLEAIGVDALAPGAVLDFDLLWKVKGPQVRFIHAVLAPDAPLEPLPPIVPFLRPALPPMTGGSIVIGRGGAMDLPDLIAKSFAALKRVARPEADAPLLEAVCKWFSRAKGFGFLVPVEDGQDIFVHMDVLRECGIRALRQGQRARVQVAHTPKGMVATEIELDTDGG